METANRFSHPNSYQSYRIKSSYPYNKKKKKKEIMIEESRNDQVVCNYSLISVATDISCHFASRAQIIRGFDELKETN